MFRYIRKFLTTPEAFNNRNNYLNENGEPIA